MWTAAFWKDLAERVVKTFLQAFLAVGVLGQTTDLVHANWVAALSAGGAAALVALVTGLIAGMTGDTQTASFLRPPVAKV